MTTRLAIKRMNIFRSQLSDFQDHRIIEVALSLSHGANALPLDGTAKHRQFPNNYCRAAVYLGMIDSKSNFNPNVDCIAGCLIGTAVGDAIGLPYEGLSPRRAQRLLGPPDRHRFLFRRGMVSDDTEHACMVLQSLLQSSGKSSKFQHNLGARLRWWLLSLPAGTGLATARAIFKLWLGYSPKSSGVFSAGNGPAMRSPILGVMLPLDRIYEYVAASSRITHSDPKATWGAVAVAIAAYLACRREPVSPEEYTDLLKEQLYSEPANEFLALIDQAAKSVEEFESTVEFSSSFASARGVTGYVYQTVPVAIHAWLSNQNDYEAAIKDIIQCGGDADTTAAIVGGIVGASVGIEGIPMSWRRGLCDWPLSLAWIEELADAARPIDSTDERTVPQLPFFGRIARNLLFLPIVLAHGFRRLAPPY